MVVNGLMSAGALGWKRVASILISIGAVAAATACADPCRDDGLGQSECAAAEASATGGGSCEPGTSVACACPGGSQGTQTCSADGQSFGVCECDTGSADGSGTAGDSLDDGATVGNDGGGQCGDGIEDSGECDENDPAFCPEDCADDSESATSDSGSSDGTNVCDDAPIFGVFVQNVPSQWTHQASAGYAAGSAMCAASTPVGQAAYHVCDYEEVVAAAAAGEFVAVAAGTTAWIHRTTAATVDGVVSQPGVGGRCVDWTYPTNHISDGEYVEFGAGGAATFHLDNDTFYDGVDTTHAIPDQLGCGGTMRAIPCCHAPCEE